MNYFGVIFILTGLFSLSAGIFDWDWYMTHRKARLFVKIFTRNGARVFYGLLGAGLIVLGVLVFEGRVGSF
ncbi:MAG: immunity 17 family protein [Spirochaetes bacterium]|nr:immunity 17 family protein [Spirochaetota bacterium]